MTAAVSRSGVGLARVSGPTEDRDLVRDDRRVRAVHRSWDALVEAIQAARPDRGQLVRRRLVLDDDRDVAETLAERRGQPVECLDDDRLEVGGVECGRVGHSSSRTRAIEK